MKKTRSYNFAAELHVIRSLERRQLALIILRMTYANFCKRCLQMPSSRNNPDGVLYFCTLIRQYQNVIDDST